MSESEGCGQFLSALTNRSPLTFYVMFARFIQLGIKRQFAKQPLKTSTVRSTKWFNNHQFKLRFAQRYSTQAEPKKKGIKALIQEYGYSALGVYLALSCIDLPLCFVLVHSVGVDQVREYQKEVKNKIKGIFGYDTKSEEKDVIKVEEAKGEKEEEKTGFWNNPLVIEGVLAYAIHKSLVFIRVPITAALTPSVVRTLRGWGFNIGKQKMTTLAQQIKASPSIVNKNKVNLGTPPSKRQKWFSWFF